MTPARYSAEIVVAAGAEVGEGPRWDGRHNRLVWVDILGRVVHLTDPDTGHDARYPIGHIVGAAALRADGGYLLAIQGGLAAWHPGTAPTMLTPVESGDQARRPNDAAVDPAGRLVVGTTSTDPSAESSGVLYRSDGETVSCLADGLGLPNGLDWSVDGLTLYFTDSLERTVGAYDYMPEAGRLGPPTGRIQVDKGLPDGHTVDAEDNVWVARWSAGTVAAYTRQGRLIATVEVPVSTVTSCAFGGPGLDTLFITTMRPTDVAHPQPHGGDLFACHVGAVGKPPHQYRW